VELNERQKRFADEYIKEPNASKAAVKAGYSEKGANSKGAQLYANVSIRKYIDERLKKHESSTIASQEEVLETLTAIMRQEKQDTLIVRVGGGYEEVRVPCKVADAYKAADSLAKRYGLYVPEQKDDGNAETGIREIPVPLPLDAFPDGGEA
jgi:phage terminase small subunit